MRVDFSTVQVTKVEDTNIGRRESVTVDVAFKGRTTTVEGYRFPDSAYSPDTIYLKGFVGRYRTSTKAWAATVRATPEGKVFAHFGRDDRSGRFNKLDGISYEPAL